MSVSFDAATPSNAFNGVSSKAWNHTCGATADYLRVCVGYEVYSSGTSAPTCTYNTVNMAMVGAGADHATFGSTHGYAFIFELKAPTTGGTPQVLLTFNNTGGMVSYGAAGAQSYIGVNQTTASGTLVTNTGTSTTPSVTVTGTTSGNMVSDAVAENGFAITRTTTGSTQRFNSNGSGIYGAGQDVAAGGDIAMSWSNSNSTFAICAAEILAASGGAATVTRFLSLLGCGA